MIHHQSWSSTLTKVHCITSHMENATLALGVSVKWINDKGQITVTFAVSVAGDLLLRQLIYTEKTKKDVFRTLTSQVILIWHLQKIIGPTWSNLLTILERSFFHSFRKPNTKVVIPKSWCLYLSWTLLKVKVTTF